MIQPQPKNDTKLKIVSFFLEFQILTSLEIGTRRGGDEVAVLDLPFFSWISFGKARDAIFLSLVTKSYKKVVFLEMIRVD